ncbi:MAG: hypothetical protein R2848_10395 [Thermomicrobiales bacterium]
MQWSADKSAGFSITSELWAPIINDRSTDTNVNVADQEEFPRRC